MSARVEVTRGGVVESTHAVDVVVVRHDERVALAGSPGRVFFARSAVKPFQAMPLVEDGVLDRYGLGLEELALACASHSGEARHVAVARSTLEKAGAPESALACGPHPPFDDEAAEALRAAGEAPGRVHNNCSGKHAGMLALAQAHGWPLDGYHEAAHPVQQRMLDEIERWTGVDRTAIATGVDGCGVVTFAFPLEGLARAFARLVAAEEEPGPKTVVEAMAAHPLLVAGSGRLGTRLAEVTAGRVLAKVGAEGVYGALVRDRELGIALKARDGAKRAGEVALIGALDALGVLEPAEREALADRARPTVENTRGEAVGELRPAIELHTGTDTDGETGDG
jgi:L-asparaginase II